MNTRFREPVNGFTHLGAAIVALFGLIYMLVIGTHTLFTAFVLVVYGFSQIVMFGSSAIYHLKKATPEGLKKLRKLDHSAIYISIAGTYTPICLYFFTGFWQTGMLTIIWIAAAVGILGKLVFPAAPRWISTAVYLIMGWFSLFAIKEIVTAIPNAGLVWFFSGAFFYTVGAVVYAIKKPNFFNGVLGFHELWHIFVILGSFSHYILIAFFIAPNF